MKTNGCLITAFYRAAAVLCAAAFIAVFAGCGNPWWPDRNKLGENGSDTDPARPVTSTLRVTYHPDADAERSQARAVGGEAAVNGEPPVDANLYAPGDPVTVKTNTAEHTPQPMTKPGYVFAEWVDHPNYIEEGNSITSASTITIDDDKNLWALWLPEDQGIEIHTDEGGRREKMRTKKLTVPPRQTGSQGGGVQITIYNTFNIDIITNTLIVNIVPSRDTPDDAFDVEMPTSFPRGGHAPFTITPRAGLPAGNYSIMIEITGSVPGTIYAIFIVGFVVTPTPVRSFTVTFNSNGGTGTAPEAQTASEGSAITLPSGGGLSKSGRDFGGWNTRADGTGANYGPGASYTVTGSATLYANWVADNGPPYSVTFSAGTGATGSAPSPLENLDAGEEITVPGPGGLHRDGFDFLGWRSHTGELFLEDVKVTVRSDLLLTAEWVPHANGLSVTTSSGSFKVGKAEYFGSYAIAGVQEDILITNISNQTVGPFRISNIDRIEGSFDLVYVDAAGNESEVPVVFEPQTRRARSTVTLNQYVTPALAPGQSLIFRIRPASTLLDAGTYHLNVSIADNHGNGASFAMTFTVKPLPLAVATGEESYSNPNTANGGRYLSPIAAPALNYTEREMRFSVAVSGFANAADANAAGIKIGLLDKNAVAAAAGLSVGGNGWAQGGTPTAAGNGKYQRTYNVTVALTDTAPFPTGAAELYVAVDIAAGSNYDSLSRTNHALDVKIIDGHASNDANRLIPVNQTNALPFNVYARTTNGLTRHYKQTQDITLTAPGTGGSNWTAIGDGAGSFSGSYDGDDKTIKNLTINSSINRQGLFGYNEGTLKNIKVENVSVTSTGQSIGGVVGNNFAAGKVINCHSTGNVSGNIDVGGVVGGNSAAVSGSSSSATITGIGTGGHGFGGVVGASGGTVTSSNFTGTVTGNNQYTGGVVGWNSGANAKVDNCYSTGTVTGTTIVGGVVGHNTATVTSSHSTGTVTGGTSATTAAHVGGVVGQNSGGTVDNCYSEGAVTATGYRVGGVVGTNISGGKVMDSHSKGSVTGDSLNVGGVVGMNTGANSLVQNCYSEGAVHGDYLQIGGVVGLNQDNAKVLDCYSTGPISGDGNYPGGTIGNGVGGIVGHNQSGGEVSGCYSTGTVEGTTQVGGIVGYNDSYSGIPKIENCSSSAAVIGSEDKIGGIVGENKGAVISSYATGVVSGYGDNAGGVVGQNSGTVTSSYATGVVSGYGDNAGGVIGQNSGTVSLSYYTGARVEANNLAAGVVGSNSGTVEYSYAKGAVITANSSTAGGVVGNNTGATSIVQFCFSDGNTIIAEYGSNSGGIAGWSGRGATVRDSYATGGSVKARYYVGGIVGMTNTESGNGGGSVVKNCYSTIELTSNANATVGGVGSTSPIGGIVGLNQGTNIAAETRDNVALNPRINGTNANGVGRISGSWPTPGGYTAPILSNNYGRQDMATGYSATNNASGKDGATITAANWDSASWWQTTAQFSASAWEFRNGPPTLKGMPADTVQNPVVE